MMENLTSLFVFCASNMAPEQSHEARHKVAVRKRLFIIECNLQR